MHPGANGLALWFFWYLVITLLGWITFPLAFRLLPALTDRGYALSRALGLLAWSYLLWLLASLGILRNDPGGLLFALAVLVGLSLWAVRGIALDEFRAWWQTQRKTILVVELLFLFCFAAWAVVRAANPEAVGTEKPMELAFINAILRSPEFPPHDPWLSGYAISYYYFGYVMTAMLAKITGTPGSIAFNLGIANTFALSAVGAYGLVYNLLSAARTRKSSTGTGMLRSPSLLAPLLGPFFILIVSNLEGFLHSLHNSGRFWPSPFWQWLGIKDLDTAPVEPFSWIPGRFWWWWRASRVLQDFDLANNPKEIIDEFPFFSYLLADLHPHVLSMPFALLAIALALNLLLGGAKGEIYRAGFRLSARLLAWIGTLALPISIVLLGAGLAGFRFSLIALGLLVLLSSVFLLVRLRKPLAEYGIDLLLRPLDLPAIQLAQPLALKPASFLLGALVLGGLAFLNTWDFPVYVGLYAAAYAMWRAQQQKRPLSATITDFLWLGALTGAAGILLYLPFYLGFSSQAGGILPNLVYVTRGAHFWVMFAPLLLPVFSYLAFLAHQAERRRSVIIQGLVLTGGILAGLLVFTLLLGLAIAIIPQVSDLYRGTISAASNTEMFAAAFTRRLASPGAWLSLAAMLALCLGLLWQSLTAGPEQDEGSRAAQLPAPAQQADIFALLLILWGALLVLAPEFVFLRDQFGWRMNTIFKFYFQAWLLWGIAAAFVSALLWKRLRGAGLAVFGIAWVLVISMSVFYPVFSLWNKTNGFNPASWTLDSAAYLASRSPEELAAIRWLQTAPYGVVAEAVPATGGSYSDYGRAATHSGLPGVLGWMNHEGQWRGGYTEMGNRQPDLERLYCSRDWEETRAILDKYQIRYVFIGTLERIAYASDGCSLGVIDAKFQRYLNPVFQIGPVTIYEYSG
jgi:uncharacterized membrane protein